LEENMISNKNAVRFALALVALVVPACGGGMPDEPGAWRPEIVFVADASKTGTDELFAADLEGTHVVTLSGTLVAGGNVTLMSWSPDGTKIAFLADKDVDETFELYVVGATGGAPVKVSGPLVAGGDVRGFAWSPDGSRLAYTADQDVDETVELYTSLASGAGNNKLSGAMPAGAGVDLFNWAPNGSRIAYRVFGTTVLEELHTCLPAGGGDVTVSGPPVLPGLPIRFAWAPDGSHLAYENYEDGFSGAELYTVLPDGSGKVRVSGGVGVISDSFFGSWSPDATRIAYLLHISGSPTVLYTVKPDGTGSAPFVGAGLPVWSPDGARLAYVADVDMDGTLDLHTALPDGTGDVIVSGPMVAGGDVGWYTGNGLSFAWSPDGSRIAYYADQTTDGQVELFTSPAAGGGNIKVSTPLPGKSLVSGVFLWSPDGSRLSYRVDGTGSDLFTAAPAVAASAVQVSGPPASGSVGLFFWSRSGARAVFVNDGELYSCLAAGGGLAHIGGPGVKFVAVLR
jgi:Tol biopolymer transport system component